MRKNAREAPNTQVTCQSGARRQSRFYQNWDGTFASNKKRKWVVLARHTEVIASRSELLSLHCPRHPLFHAQLPAWGVSQVIMRQETLAYAEEPLRTVGLQEAAHQYSLRDVCGSTRTPTLPTLHTPEWQFTNLKVSVWVCARLPVWPVRKSLKTCRGARCESESPSTKYLGPRLWRLWISNRVSWQS